MSDRKQLWTLAQEAMQAFGPFYREAMQKAIQDSGAPDDWYSLMRARHCEPAPLTVEHSHAMAPYSARERHSDGLEKLAGLELLERVGEDAYRLTDQGSEALEGIFTAAHQSLGAAEPLPAGKMDELNNVLYRLVEATLEAPKPGDKLAIGCSRLTDPGEETPGAVRADQYLTDLYFFRDDAHTGAWRPYGVDGRAWEALTFVWLGEAGTAEELAEKLPYRLYSAEDYAGAMQDLAERGWLVEESGVFKVTAEGKRVREEAEEETDRLFFAPWDCLSEVETARLEALLTELREKAQEMAGSEEG